MRPNEVLKVAAWSTVALAVVMTAVTLSFQPAGALPESADVRELRCRYVTPQGLATIYATVRNSTDEPRDYEIQVNFETRAGVRVGEGYVVVRRAAPGQDVKVQTTADFTPGTVPVRCVLDEQ
jgi:hypothetical protein